jgi:hypothetical protein
MPKKSQTHKRNNKKKSPKKVACLVAQFTWLQHSLTHTHTQATHTGDKRGAAEQITRETDVTVSHREGSVLCLGRCDASGVAQEEGEDLQFEDPFEDEFEDEEVCDYARARVACPGVASYPSTIR